jgi:hypothetical protein
MKQTCNHRKNDQGAKKIDFASQDSCCLMAVITMKSIQKTSKNALHNAEVLAHACFLGADYPQSTL